MASGAPAQSCGVRCQNGAIHQQQLLRRENAERQFQERMYEQDRLDRGARDARIEAYAPVPRRNCTYGVRSYDTGKETTVGVIGRWWHC
jgi:hypothetical protein